VDITFWVIQAILLAPVLFMAASAGMESQPGRSRPTPPSASGGAGSAIAGSSDAEAAGHGSVARVAGAVAASALGQFSADQQARLMHLRARVQEARRGRGGLYDDLMATADTEQQPVRAAGGLTNPRPRPSRRQLFLAGGALLVAIGLIGAVRTSLAMDQLQRNATTSRVVPFSPAERFLPGVIVSPAKYLSAVNGAIGLGSSGVDPLYAVNLMYLKQAMDRWEALAAAGLGLVLFLKVIGKRGDEETQVASDVAPFVLVAAALLAGLSFFELP
jgi:hypothetical protein